MDDGYRARQTPVIPPNIFREYDVRGLAGPELNAATARIIGRAYAEWIEERPEFAGGPRRMVVGRDNRLSSPELAEGIARGFADAGWQVVDLGVVPTPVFYFARVKHGLDAGVMVTGSHNEARFNGFKLAWGPGTIYGEDIQELGRRARRLAESATEAARGDGPVAGLAGPATDGDPFAERLDPLPSYFSDLTGRIRLQGREGRRARPLRVAVDCGSGAASLVAPSLFRDLGCEVVSLYCEPDGNFPGHWPDPVKAENLVELQQAVREEGADLGVAFDGDADRLGVVDDQGQILWGDDLMILFWREILAKNPKAKAIIEVKCSQALVDEVRRLGGEPLFYRTGHSLIKAKMREISAPFAGEMSGHLFFADEYYGFDDAIYAATRLMRILDGSDRPLSELIADRPRYYATPETRLECPDDTKFAVVESVRRHFVSGGREVIDVDGARVLFPEGWLLVRASNTQPALVVRCEGTTPEGLAFLKRATTEALVQAGSYAGLELPDW